MEGRSNEQPMGPDEAQLQDILIQDLEQTTLEQSIWNMQLEHERRGQSWIASMEQIVQEALDAQREIQRDTLAQIDRDIDQDIERVTNKCCQLDQEIEELTNQYQNSVDTYDPDLRELTEKQNELLEETKQQYETLRATLTEEAKAFETMRSQLKENAQREMINDMAKSELHFRNMTNQMKSDVEERVRRSRQRMHEAIERARQGELQDLRLVNLGERIDARKEELRQRIEQRRTRDETDVPEEEACQICSEAEVSHEVNCPARHSFCDLCAEWFQIDGRCPMCRGEVTAFSPCH